MLHKPPPAAGPLQEGRNFYVIRSGKLIITEMEDGVVVSEKKCAAGTAVGLRKLTQAFKRTRCLQEFGL